MKERGQRRNSLLLLKDYIAIPFIAEWIAINMVEPNRGKNGGDRVQGRPFKAEEGRQK